MNEICAYMAGILDGEGSVLLNKINKSRFRTPVVSISNNDKNIIKLFYNNYGGSIIKKKKYKEKHEQSYEWRVTYYKAINVLKDLLPYMLHKEKIRRANLIINIYPIVTKRNGKYTDKEILDKLEFEKEFFNPNSTNMFNKYMNQ